MAESAVKAAKRLLTKTKRDGSDVSGALLELRNTPRQGSGMSPAQAMFGRRTRSHVPCTNLCMPPVSTQSRADRRARHVIGHHDRRARELPVLHQGQLVRVAPSPATGPTWTEAVVTAAHGRRSYTVNGEGAVLRRNRVDLRPAADLGGDARAWDARRSPRTDSAVPVPSSDATVPVPSNDATVPVPGSDATAAPVPGSGATSVPPVPRRSGRQRHQPVRYGC